MTGLSGRSAIVTAGAMRMGEAIAPALARCGVDVLVTDGD